jgi:hypothetical protein
MIPHTFPAVLTTTQISQMTVATITPTTAQIAWLDYIPVTLTTTPPSALNSYDIGGAIAANQITPTTAQIAWLDYVPVQPLTTSALTAFSTDAGGFIPLYKP